MLTSKETKDISELAKLTLSEAEAERLRGQLSGTLKYVEILKELDTARVKPTAQVTGLNNVFSDLSLESLDQRQALANAKRKKNNLFETDAVF